MNSPELLARLGYFEYNWRSEEFYGSKGFFSLLGLEQSRDRVSFDGLIGSVHEDDRELVRKRFQEDTSGRRNKDIECRPAAKEWRNSPDSRYH